MQFLAEAKLITHPFDSARALPDPMLRVLFTTLTKGPLEIMKIGLAKLKLWKQWAAELQPEERALRSSMAPSVRKVLGNKRIALLRKVAESLEWPDTSVFGELTEGFRLTGYMQRTGIFTPDAKPANSTESEFWLAAPIRRTTLWEKVQSQPEQDYSEAIWSLTLEEADQEGKAWLEGPYGTRELDAMFGGVWSPCRRFGVWQNKWRAIDDMTECGVNACFGCFERLSLRALDELCWTCLALMRAAKAKGHVCFVLSTGERLEAPLHKLWHDCERVRPVTKTFDLKAAYKQLPLHPEERTKCVITVKSPENRAAKGFVCNTLPFGSSASVMHFNRISLLLQRILWEVQVLATCYYDDFPVASPCFLGQGTDQVVHAVMDLFGFDLSLDKEQPFGTDTETLGVMVNTADLRFEVVTVGNKPDRAAAMVNKNDDVLAKGAVVTREVPSVLGRLQFSKAQLLGRAGRLALADLRVLEQCASQEVTLSQTHVDALLMLKRRLVASVPRAILTSPCSSPVLVFTDGACEPCEPCGETFKASIGGVLVDPRAQVVRTFGAVLPECVVSKWASGRKHIVGQTELYAVVMARVLWKSTIGGQRCFFFVDHSGVLSSVPRATPAGESCCYIWSWQMRPILVFPASTGFPAIATWQTHLREGGGMS